MSLRRLFFGLSPRLSFCELFVLSVSTSSFFREEEPVCIDIVVFVVALLSDIALFWLPRRFVSEV